MIFCQSFIIFHQRFTIFFRFMLFHQRFTIIYQRFMIFYQRLCNSINLYWIPLNKFDILPKFNVFFFVVMPNNMTMLLIGSDTVVESQNFKNKTKKVFRFCTTVFWRATKVDRSWRYWRDAWVASKEIS